MTRNQLTYWQNVETKRNNQAIEAETKRANLQREWLNTKAHYENVRHNQAMEKLESQKRTNERYSTTVSYNLGSQQNRETTRSNMANELISNRANKVSQFSATTNRLKQLEDQRANLERERQNLISLAEIQRANLEREAENRRQNVNRESIQRLNSGIAIQTFQETRRHNLASEKMMLTQAQYNLVGNLIGALGRVSSANQSGRKVR